MTKAIVTTFKTTYEYRLRITAVLMIACLIFIFSYALNIYRLITRSVAIQSVQNNITETSREINMLAVKYLSLQSEITPDTLKEYNMSEGRVTAYIEKTLSSGRVALNGRGI